MDPILNIEELEPKLAPQFSFPYDDGGSGGGYWDGPLSGPIGQDPILPL